MTRLNAFWGRTTDTLSALLLLLAVILAGGYGPLTAQATAVPVASQSPTDAGTGGHRSTPVIAKQQLLASEIRDKKAAPWDDGKPKAFLPSGVLELPAPTKAAGSAAQAFASAPSTAASDFDARAPPAIS
ncbi:hypothetical protein [Mesorhizobium sp. KR9-304]|uniref:hypothetical protein n=1 Tax=Mesorhizobium sp. KR9-304 TaxID=3156614 RepID=UPI0032B504A1